MKNLYLTKVQREQFSLSEKLREILVGLYLGDLCGQRQKACKNARLMFRQGTIHTDYLLHNPATLGYSQLPRVTV